MRVFVTGVSTDVGKTVVSAWICAHLNATYYKPIQTGPEKDSDFVSRTVGAPIIPESYWFAPPVSPHLAAGEAGVEICINKLVSPQDAALVVEGAGGVLVPINTTHTMLDVMRFMKLPVVVVTQSYLGTINHTLLTLECLKSAQIPVLGFVMSGDYALSNVEAITQYSSVSFLGGLPTLSCLKKEILLQYPINL